MTKQSITTTLSLLLIAVIATLFVLYVAQVNPDYATVHIASSDWLSLGVVSAGMFSVGIVSAGLFSVGVVSAGMFSFGIVNAALIGLGIWSFKKAMTYSTKIMRDTDNDQR